MHADRIVRTVCSPNCSGCCGVNAYVKDDRILKIEPASYPDQRFSRICLKGISMAMQRVNHPTRLRYPLRRTGKRGEDKWERISWDEAFDALAQELTRIGEQYGPEANAWTTMTGNYGIKATTAPNRMANSVGGTWFTYLGLMGDCGCSMGYLPTMGVFNTANEWSDQAGARLIILLARNLADTGHSEMHFLFDAMEAGAKLVVIDPRFSRTATKADQWISPRPGTDTALILGMLQVIIEEQRYDHDYVTRHTNAPFLVRSDNGALLRERDLVAGGSDAFMVMPAAGGGPVAAGSTDDVALSGRWPLELADGSTVACRTGFDIMAEAWAGWTPERAAEVCEVPAATIRQLAREYAGTKPAAIWLGQGAQRYYHGHLTFRAAITLGALCGNIGRRHAGVNWSDGALFRLFFSLPEEWLAPNGHRGRQLPGTRMLDAICDARPYPVKSLWLAGYGFGTQSPNFDRFVNEALPNLELFVVTEQVMTPAAKYADILLPCVSYYEDDLDLVPGAENLYLQLRRRAIPNVGESLDDWSIFKGVAERMGRGEDWQIGPEESCRYIIDHATDPAVSGIDWDRLKRDGVVRLNLPEPHVPFSDLQFPTPSGRIELYTEALHDFGQEILVFEEPIESNRQAAAKEYPLTMMTSHPMHTVHSQHTNLPWIRELLRGPRLEIHPSDAAARGISDEDLVTVFNDRGRFRVRATLTEAVRPGTLNMPQGWWPEHFPDGHYNNVSHLTVNPVQDAIIETNFAVFDNLVEVRRSEAA